MSPPSSPESQISTLSQSLPLRTMQYPKCETLSAKPAVEDSSGQCPTRAMCPTTQPSTPSSSTSPSSTSPSSPSSLIESLSPSTQNLNSSPNSSPPSLCSSWSTSPTSGGGGGCGCHPSKGGLSWWMFVLLASLVILLLTSVLAYSSTTADFQQNPVPRSHSPTFDAKLVDLIKLKLDSSSGPPQASNRNSRQLSGRSEADGRLGRLSEITESNPRNVQSSQLSESTNRDHSADDRSRSVISRNQPLGVYNTESLGPVESQRFPLNVGSHSQQPQQQQTSSHSSQDIKQRVLQYLAGKISKSEKYPSVNGPKTTSGQNRDSYDGTGNGNGYNNNRRHQFRVSNQGSVEYDQPRMSGSKSQPESLSQPTRPLLYSKFNSPVVTTTSAPVVITTPTPRMLRNLSSSSDQIAKLFSDLNRQTKSVAEQDQARELGPDGTAVLRSCGESVMITTSYEISSPNYPQKYSPNMRCVWDIRAGKDQMLRVQIFKLSIEVDMSCRFDYLDIEGVREVDRKTRKERIRTKRICGVNLHGSEYKIGSNHTKITFNSDSSGEMSGFYLRVIAESQDCINQIYVNNSTFISSPKYPKNYDDSKNCWTQVKTLPDHRLLVNFQDLNLESDSRCAFDYVEVFDSLLANQSKSFGKFCQFPPNSSLLLASSENSLLFHFESDNFLGLRGYMAKISALRLDVNVSSYMNCNWSVDWNNMTIASPFYPKPYPPGTTCETSISASSVQDRIVILFDWIDLVTDLGLTVLLPQNDKQSLYRNSGNLIANCSLDRLEIWESINDSRPSKVYCGHRSQPFKFVSSGNSIKLVFRSANQQQHHNQQQQSQDRVRVSSTTNASGNSPGFRARFAFVERKTPGSSDSHINKSKTKDHGNGLIEDGGSNKEFVPNVTLTTQTMIPVLIRRPVNASVMLGSSHILHCEVQNRQTTRSATAPALNDGRFNNHQKLYPPGMGSTATPSSASVSSSSTQAIPIIWFKGDREIHDGVSPDGTSLLIRQFRSSSAGRYICVYGDNSSDAWLTVREDREESDQTSSSGPKTCTSSTVLFRERPKDQYTSEGEFVMLHCSVSTAGSMSDTSSGGDGTDSEDSNLENEVIITWEKLPLHFSNKEQLDDPNVNKPRSVEYNSRIKQLRRGDLLFDPALVEDSGFYFCVVRLKGNENRRGSNRNNNSTDDGQTFPLDQIDPGSDPNLEDCVFKSAARVQINQRVDVRQYCGRSLTPQSTDGSGEKPALISDAGKIIGGTEAQPGEFPWMVMFWDEKRHVFCGGALLNERWVVTAAHCFTDITDESTVFVKLGKYDQTSTEPTELVTKIQHITKHPHFSYKTFDNDIALVKLVQHVTFTDYILPICMPASSDELQALREFYFTPEPPPILQSSDSQISAENNNGNGGGSGNGGSESDTKFGFVAGWGRLKENGPLPRYLHKIRLPIVEEERCHRTTQFNVTDNMFCAGYGKEIVGDACKGDSGGPFAVQFEDRWTLLGVVSWGEGCGRPEKFGYYTKVTNFDNWIRRLTRNTY